MVISPLFRSSARRQGGKAVPPLYPSAGGHIEPSQEAAGRFRIGIWTPGVVAGSFGRSTSTATCRMLTACRSHAAFSLDEAAAQFKRSYQTMWLKAVTARMGELGMVIPSPL